jgi:hypothetical protein
LPKVSKRSSNRTKRARLHQHIADSSCFDRAGDDRHPTRVGSELAQQRIARAAADDVQYLNRPTAQLLRLANC